LLLPFTCSNGNRSFFAPDKSTLPYLLRCDGFWSKGSNFTFRMVFATLQPMNFCKIIGFTVLAALLTGCSTTVTNLTPRQMPRSDKNLYPFEVSLDTSQRSVVDETIKAYVMIGFETYPMQPTPMLKNRWDTLVPIPAGTNFVHYRYKFDYEYLAIPQRKQGSILSPMYTLEIQDTPK
jgi:hypothetical protein